MSQGLNIALTGATGIIGSKLVSALRSAGHRIDPLPGYRLGDAPNLTGHDALVHTAFSHLPGRYRGGEGDDPARFRTENLDGSLRLFQAAAQARLGRVVFLSSRAVHDGHPAGTRLTDSLPPAPTTLYGEVKARAEAALTDLLPESSVSLRATGVYGPGRAMKWAALFDDFLSGRPVAPRVATEVHIADLAEAVLLCLRHPSPATLNVSDLVLDRHDLLDEVARLSGSRYALPDRADTAGLRIPDCAGLHKLGWQPGGMARLRDDLPAILDQAGLL